MLVVSVVIGIVLVMIGTSIIGPGEEPGTMAIGLGILGFSGYREVVTNGRGSKSGPVEPDREK